MSKKAKSFEEMMERIEQIVSVLEGGDLPLEEMMTLYQEGALLVSECSERLKIAESRLTEPMIVKKESLEE
ncbi:MAG: exodeoxyribonuclease VII small subunit [Ruminococcaceae bacterium]|nr:exodeoxyribonuclease VII small subunit [Oscillospiraceae bacterium]